MAPEKLRRSDLRVLDPTVSALRPSSSFADRGVDHEPAFGGSGLSRGPAPSGIRSGWPASGCRHTRCPSPLASSSEVGVRPAPLAGHARRWAWPSALSCGRHAGKRPCRGHCGQAGRAGSGLQVCEQSRDQPDRGERLMKGTGRCCWVAVQGGVHDENVVNDSDVGDVDAR
jgi:hypothetical protein